jgi:hypothetical protein
MLTDAEKRELADRPIKDSATAFTPDVLNFRRKIAKKMCRALAAHNPEIATCASYFMGAFWVTKNDPAPRRIYGFVPDDTTRCYTVACHNDFRNITTETIPLADMRETTWSAEQIAMIYACVAPGIFLDPLGFYTIMLQQANANKN